MPKNAKIVFTIAVVIVIAIIAIAVIPEIIKIVDNNQAVIVVNGEKVTKKQFKIKFEETKQQYIQYLGSEAALNQKMDGNKTYKEYIKEQLIDGLATQRVQLQKAKSLGIKLTSAEEKKIDDTIKEYKTNTQYKDSFKQYLQLVGATEEDFKKEMIENQIYSKLYDQITKNQKVTDSEVQNYYNSNKDKFIEVKASHILLKVNNASDDAKQKKKAEEILARIKKGEDFTVLAKTYSEDEGTKANGGDLGYFRKGQMVSNFENAAFSLSIGEVSNVIKTEYGYHIIKVADRKQLTFDEAKSEIKNTLETEKKDSYFQKQTDEWVKKATIKKYPNVVKDLT